MDDNFELNRMEVAVDDILTPSWYPPRMVEKTIQSLSDDRQCPGRDSNRPPAYIEMCFKSSWVSTTFVVAYYWQDKWFPWGLMRCSSPTGERFAAGPPMAATLWLLCDVCGSLVGCQGLTPISIWLGSLFVPLDRGNCSEPYIWHRLYLWCQRSWVYL
jgi:hypothetical protein